MPKFPKTLYVKWEPCANSPPYLDASKTPDGQEPLIPIDTPAHEEAERYIREREERG